MSGWRKSLRMRVSLRGRTVLRSRSASCAQAGATTARAEELLMLGPDVDSAAVWGMLESTSPGWACGTTGVQAGTRAPATWPWPAGSGSGAVPELAAAAVARDSGGTCAELTEGPGDTGMLDALANASDKRLRIAIVAPATDRLLCCNSAISS